MCEMGREISVYYWVLLVEPMSEITKKANLVILFGNPANTVASLFSFVFLFLGLHLTFQYKCFFFS